MANGNDSESFSPVWYGVAAVILIVLTMGTIVMIKPLEFKPVAAVHCEGEACAHEGAAPTGEPAAVSHEATPAEHAPAPAEHHE